MKAEKKSMLEHAIVLRFSTTISYEAITELEVGCEFEEYPV